ncbi:IS1380-Spn1, transposase, partial [uncultured Gammaproteobacteria bacterium]
MVIIFINKITNVGYKSRCFTTGQYIYHSIATNLETLSDSKVIHFYNQRGEDSENRIKELKNDFGA